MIHQQKPNEQEGNTSRDNLMWTPKEVWSNRAAKLSKQRQSKKHTFQESEEETYPEDALKLMFDYFNKKIEVMQAQTKTWNFLGRNIKNQKTEISFVIQECQHQILRGNIEDVCHSNIDCNAAKKRNKLIKLADWLPVVWSILQEQEKKPLASDSDNAQKIRQAEQRAIRKKESKNTHQFYTVIIIHDL